MNTKKKGNIGLGAAIAKFLEKGFVVSIPVNDSQKYDLVVEIEGVLKKSRCKNNIFKNNSWDLFGWPQNYRGKFK